MTKDSMLMRVRHCTTLRCYLSKVAAHILPWILPKLIVTGIASVLTLGCSLHYYDPTTGVDHSWGISHIQMKILAPQEGVRATIKGIQSLGVGIGANQTDYYIHAGWNDYRLLQVHNDNTCLRVDWPSDDFFSIRVGTASPNNLADTSATHPIKEDACFDQATQH